MDKCFPSKKIVAGSDDNLTMSRHLNAFFVKRSLLYREIVDKTQKIGQLVVPFCFRKQVLESLHNQVGHPGREKTVCLVKTGFIGRLILQMLHL